MKKTILVTLVAMMTFCLLSLVIVGPNYAVNVLFYALTFLAFLIYVFAPDDEE